MRVLVPVSGGKDSQACVALAVDEFGVEQVEMVHQHTGFDHPLTYTHMQYMVERYSVPLITIKSEKYVDVPDVIAGTNIIPNSRVRVCTEELKLKPWFAWLKKQPDKDSILIWLGMRAPESTQRMERYAEFRNDEVFDLGDLQPRKTPKAIRHIKCQLRIVEQTTPWVFEFLRSRKDKINPLYGMGHFRVGCFPCALAGKRTMHLTARDPVGRQHMQALDVQVKRVFAIRKFDEPERVFEHDLQAILEHKDADPFGLRDDDGGGCSWCNI